MPEKSPQGEIRFPPQPVGTKTTKLRARVYFNNIYVTGSITGKAASDKSMIWGIARRHIGELRTCYERELAKNKVSTVVSMLNG